MSAILRSRYQDFAHHNQRNPLNELLFILCSIQTDEVKYLAAYRALRRTFPNRDQLLKASKSEIATTIKKAGMSLVKANAIKKILAIIVNRFGHLSLAPLTKMTDDECEDFLTSLPMIGKKIARCTMMYSLKRKVFPVDVNCWRIARRLGWIRRTKKDGTCSQRDMDRLQNKIPPNIRYSLHVNFISLGREMCTPKNPKCNICPINKFCSKILTGFSTN